MRWPSALLACSAITQARTALFRRRPSRTAPARFDEVDFGETARGGIGGGGRYGRKRAREAASDEDEDAAGGEAEATGPASEEEEEDDDEESSGSDAR